MRGRGAICLGLFGGEEVLSEKENILFSVGRQVPGAREQLLNICTAVTHWARDKSVTTRIPSPTENPRNQISLLHMDACYWYKVR
jgi:hypothetical protein